MRYYICIFLFFSSVAVSAADSVKQPDDVSIDFLYINANAGEAAGGHTALRLGDSIFHYQFFPDSTFLLVREPWDSFRFLYNELHNRSISVASLPLELSVAVQIRNHFTELLVAQQNFNDDFEALQQEKQLVEQLMGGILGISVKCLGFFNDKSEQIKSENLLTKFTETASLRALIEKADEDLQTAARKLMYGERPGKSFQEIVAWREALLVLVHGKTLKSDAVIYPMEEEGELNNQEKILLEEFSKYLHISIVELLDSTRPDKGETLLLQIARYLAVQRSLAEKKLFTLDPFFKEVRVVHLTDEDMRGEQVLHLKKNLLQQTTTRRELFFKEKVHQEITYSLLETSRARTWELARVNDSVRSVRILAKVTLPSRPSVVTTQFPERYEKQLQGIRDTVGDELLDLQKRREALYGYNLVWRNCATELIRSLNTTFADTESGRKALGGWLEPDDGLLFIPFLFYRESIDAYSLQNHQFLQARRLRNLENLYNQENDLWVWLRESNTLSSTLYETRSKDTPFLFFTDDALFLRPLLGFLNVGYAGLHGVVGIMRLPFDSGESFNQAARGLFYSLPELGFSNIRKGSYSTGDNTVKSAPYTSTGN
jgi:hypothetical protein